VVGSKCSGKELVTTFFLLYANYTENGQMQRTLEVILGIIGTRAQSAQLPAELRV
jgi:hypothetical protein